MEIRRQCARFVAEILDQLEGAGSSIPGRLHTSLIIMGIMGQWIFSRDISERLQTVLLGKAARASHN